MNYSIILLILLNTTLLKCQIGGNHGRSVAIEINKIVNATSRQYNRTTVTVFNIVTQSIVYIDIPPGIHCSAPSIQTNSIYASYITDSFERYIDTNTPRPRIALPDGIISHVHYTIKVIAENSIYASDFEYQILSLDKITVRDYVVRIDERNIETPGYVMGKTQWELYFNAMDGVPLTFPNYVVSCDTSINVCRSDLDCIIYQLSCFNTIMS